MDDELVSGKARADLDMARAMLVNLGHSAAGSLHHALALALEKTASASYANGRNDVLLALRAEGIDTGIIDGSHDD